MTTMSKKDPRHAIRTLLDNQFTPERRQQEYEQRVIGHILKRCQASDLYRQLQRRHYEVHGSYDVNMSFFQNVFSDFPLHLVADSLQGIKLHREKSASFARTFVAFHQTPFAKCYKMHAKKYDGEQSLVVVFPRDNVQLGLVIHAGLPNVKERVGTQIKCRSEDGEELIVESFANLLTAIYDRGRGWVPTM
jgi:hypothetical protein